MTEALDLVIIGAGPGGYNAAIRAGQLGLKTAIVEKRDTQKLGGTCLNVGCIPSKALLHASELYEAAATQFGALGIRTGGLTLDLDQMLQQKDAAVDGLTKGVEFLMKKNKVAVFYGAGEIVAPGKVRVSADGKTSDLATKNIIIATGSEVTPLKGVDIDERQIVSSTGALSFESVPKHLVVIGGGVIGLELGSVWRRLGAKITVVEFLDRILPTMDGEVSKQFERILKKQGIEFRLSSKVTGAEKTKEGVRLSVEPAAGGAALQRGAGHGRPGAGADGRGRQEGLRRLRAGRQDPGRDRPGPHRLPGGGRGDQARHERARLRPRDHRAARAARPRSGTGSPRPADPP